MFPGAMTRVSSSMTEKPAKEQATFAALGGTGRQYLAKFLVAGPPLLFLVVFFVLPSLIMIVTSFRFPGEFGGWPLLPRLRGSRLMALNMVSRWRLISSFSAIFSMPKSS